MSVDACLKLFHRWINALYAGIERFLIGSNGVRVEYVLENLIEVLHLFELDEHCDYVSMLGWKCFRI